MKMELQSVVEAYVPTCEQERVDRQLILNYINLFDDIVTRNNEMVHLTASAFVLNETRDKVLMIYHNIYQSWCWPGGHADGEYDGLAIAIKEVKEETGVENITVLDPTIFALDLLPVISHIKRGTFVASHVHISFAYLLEVSEEEILKINKDENSNVGWLPLSDFLDMVKEEHMKPMYQKIVEKAKKFSYIK